MKKQPSAREYMKQHRAAGERLLATLKRHNVTKASLRETHTAMRKLNASFFSLSNASYHQAGRTDIMVWDSNQGQWDISARPLGDTITLERIEWALRLMAAEVETKEASPQSYGAGTVTIKIDYFSSLQKKTTA